MNFFSPLFLGKNAIKNIAAAAAAKLLQLCPTCSDPMDCSLPGFSVHGISQARVLEWVTIAFSVSYSKANKKNVLKVIKLQS